MSSILITGGTGFIGSHTCLLLLERGYKVYIVDSNVNSSNSVIDKIKLIISNKDSKNIKNLNFIKSNLMNSKIINEIFQNAKNKKEPIDSVIHFAGLKSVGESNKYPLRYWENNVSGTINLLKIMDKHNCTKLIFSSSATIYSSKSNAPITEETEIAPINTYGNTKATIEKFLSDLYKSDPHKWKIANLRYFNPIGAHPSGLLGENPQGKPNNIFPLINLVATKELEKLIVYGDDWNTPDGTCIRDYIHVMDLAEGHLSALNHLETKSPKILSLNLGTGKGTSVLELINIFEKVNNVDIPFSIGSRRIGDNENVVADNSLACDLLDWRPSRSLEEMCRDGWVWKRNKKSGI
tara:strand:- start:6934 stop:7986 length:1053 start_codon:yes stop_codon:yes gene_type:complete